MNYKAIFRDSEKRIKLLQVLSFIPDAPMLKLQYWIKTGRKLDLKKPKRYSEKIQLYKIKYRDPVMAQCSDKYEVREYVRTKVGEEYLNDIYGIYDSPDQIDFDMLPNQFVIKDTLGSGDDSMILVLDKQKLDIESAKNKMKKWVNEPINTKSPGREWVYDGRKHRIIVEKMLISDTNGDLPDYKFFCFDGKVFCSYKMENYTLHHDKGVLGFFDREFNILPVRRTDFAEMKKQPVKPENYDRMVTLAEILAKDFPHVRVDLYNIEGRIIFGELTFFNASGYVMFEPDSFDFELGKQFSI